MLVFGVKGIKSPSFSWGDEADVKVMKYDLALINEELKMGKKVAVYKPKLNEAILANAAGGHYILVNDIKLAKKLSKLAEFYLFDIKIIFIKQNANNLYEVYEKTRCDGVILETSIILE